MQSSRPSAVPVCFVARGQFGGAERYLESLIAAIEPDWISRCIILGDGPFADALQAQGVDVARVKLRRQADFCSAALAVRRLLIERRPGAIHANGVVAAAVSGVAALGTGIPTVWLKVDLALDGWRTRLVALLCSEVVGMSETAVSSLRHVRGTRVSAVLAGIPQLSPDRQRGRAALQALTGSGDDDPIVVLSGRLCPGKGQLELIKSAPGVLARRPQTRFVLIGLTDPAFLDYAAVLRRRIQTLGVESAFAITLNASAAEAIELVSGADVLAAPSVCGDSNWQEGFGLAVAEAMQLGVPVVAYDSGALSEVLGPCGKIVPERDQVALAQALITMLSDPSARADAVRCGHRRARERFAIERSATEMCARYRTAAQSAWALAR